MTMDHFKHIIKSQYGTQGLAWLELLPTLVQEKAKQYQLSDLVPCMDLTYNYVLTGNQNAVPIILKLGFDQVALRQEAEALKIFAGHGAVPLIEADQGMLLIERALPGTSLKSTFPEKDTEACLIACTLMEKLHKAPLPSTHSFPHMKDWLQVLDCSWSVPQDHLEKARLLRNALGDSTAEDTFLHCDLHHDNILQKGDAWVAIDPKGVIGEPVHEVFAYLRNPQEMTKDKVMTRISIFAERLNFNKDHLIRWCFVQSIMSWIWDIEDNLPPGSRWITDILNEQIPH